MAKAADLKLRLHPSPVIALPESKSSSNEDPKSRVTIGISASHFAAKFVII